MDFLCRYFLAIVLGVLYLRRDDRKKEGASGAVRPLPEADRSRHACAYTEELAEHLEITPAAVTCALKKIEKDGYVERRTLGQDSKPTFLHKKNLQLFDTQKSMKILIGI